MFRIVLLVNDNKHKSRLRGIKKALKNMEIPFDAMYGVSPSKFNYFELK